MKITCKIILITSMVFTYNAYANQCTIGIGYIKNNLITRTIDIIDSSAFFKKNEFSDYGKKNFDIDTNKFNINNYGNQLNLTGNTWKSVKLLNFYQVKPNSILEFQFLSNGNEAKINGVGLINGNGIIGSLGSSGEANFNSDRFFQVYGTETVYNQTFHNYSGNKWKTYRIPLWSVFANTSNKYISHLLFAGEDDVTHVNQSVYYKNVRLLDEMPNYQFPSTFQYDTPIIQATSDKNIFQYIYPQQILGSDNKYYPVSGGSIIKRIYSPLGSGIQEVLTVSEHYYDNMCWEQPITYTESALENQAMSNLQVLANDTGSEVDFSEFKNQNPIKLSQSTITYFDPDLLINNSRKSRFVTQSSIVSSHSTSTYYERIDTSNGQNLVSGLIYANQVINCSNSSTGENTKGECFDLTDKTTFNSVTNEYLSENNLTTVNEDLNFPGNNDMTEHDIVTDVDDRWLEDDVKQQTTELLINTNHFEEYLNDLTNGLGFEDILGFKPQSVVAASAIAGSGNAVYSSSQKKAYFSNAHSIFNSNNPKVVTMSRDVSTVAHEFTHALTSYWYSGGLSYGTVEACAINESFSDIMGSGVYRYVNGVYNPAQGLDSYDNNDQPGGVRNFANPSLGSHGGDSIFTGLLNQSLSCSESGGGHNVAGVLNHLYHLMVTGGFNINSSHRPDKFGVSLDEILSNKEAERLFFDAVQFGPGPDIAVGFDFKFCYLRDNMLAVRNSVQQRTAIQQAWKQVYQNLESKCPLPQDIVLAKPEIEINVDNGNGGAPINVEEGGTVNFGPVNPGSSKTYTFKIKNLGDYNLRLYYPATDIDLVFLGPFRVVNGVNLYAQTTVGIGESETKNVTVSFTPPLSSNSGLIHRTLKFITNHPDYPIFTIILEGTINVAPVDAYEDDDIIEQATTIDINGPLQFHNFSDDSGDWIQLSGQQTQNSPPCPSYNFCNLKFEDINNSEICIEDALFFRSGGNRGTKTCGLSSPFSFPITTNVNGVWLFGTCMYSFPRTTFLISEETGVLSNDKNYKIKLECTQ